MILCESAVETAEHQSSLQSSWTTYFVSSASSQSCWTTVAWITTGTKDKGVFVRSSSSGVHSFNKVVQPTIDVTHVKIRRHLSYIQPTLYSMMLCSNNCINFTYFALSKDIAYSRYRKINRFTKKTQQTVFRIYYVYFALRSSFFPQWKQFKT